MTKRDAGLTRMLLDGKVRHEGGQQFLAGKGMAGERFPRVHRVEPHGFTSHPVKGGIATVMQAGGQRDSVYAMGGANPLLVPELPSGGTAIYDHLGNIVSIVQREIRIVHATKIVISAPEIVLDGLVKLGGEDASRPASAEGTIDSAGHTETGNLATMVLVK
jgi:phage gp45-like